MKAYLVTYNQSVEQPNAMEKTVYADGYIKDDSCVTFYSNVTNSSETTMVALFTLRSLVSVENIP